jgi:hypothetical protein
MSLQDLYNKIVKKPQEEKGVLRGFTLYAPATG